MRSVFVGAVEGSRVALEGLIAAGAAPGLLITLPKEAAGRHSDFADLGPLAREAGWSVCHSTSINDQPTVETIRNFEPDVCFVIGWSQICHGEFRSIARIGNIGFHPAALPRMRGRAVIPWTILENESETASTLFWLDAGVDSGPILLQENFSVSAAETAASLYQKHMQALRRMIPAMFDLLQSGNPPKKEQNHELATYCAKRTPSDGLIDWMAPAEDILRLIRAVGEPYPGAFTFSDGCKLIIDAARLEPNGHRYIGLAGQVQALTDAGFIVRCGDGKCIEVTCWRGMAGAPPKRHGRLSADI